MALLSLPPETLDNIVNYLPYPIDALNLSSTCRYFQMHLSPHNNLLWYRFCSALTSVPTISAEFLNEYNPAFSYKSGILDALRLNTCNFCLQCIRDNGNSRKRKADDTVMKVHGFRLCMKCVRKNTITKSSFRYLPLALEPPPRSTEVQLYSRWSRTNISVRYYWAADIDNLCISQLGCTLAALNKKREAERHRKEEFKKANPSALELLRQEINQSFYQEAWKLWLEDEEYQLQRATFAHGLGCEDLTAYLRVVAGTVAAEALKTIRGRKKLRENGDAWVTQVARDMLRKLEESHSYEDLCFQYHVKRITEEAERRGTVALLEQVEVCPIGNGPIDGTGVHQLVDHIREHHREAFWKGNWEPA